MDEIRVTRSALWEDNFTPPNAPFFEFDYAVYIDNNPQNGSFDPGELFFDTIQEAIDAASPGDVIQVLSGTYEEQLYINKSVELRGPNYGVNPNTQVRNPEATIRYPATDAWWALVYIDGDGDESTTTSDVTIDGFTLNGADYYGDMTELIFVAGANNVAIKNNRFQNFESIALRFYHQYYDGASWVTSYPVGAVVADNHISNPDFYSIGSIAPNTGIYLQGVYGSVTGNVVEDVLGGCQIQPYNHPNTLAETGIVSGNTFKACRNALWYNNSSNANADWLFSDNTLVGMGCPAGYTPAADWYGEPTDIWYGFAINGNSFGEIEFSGNTITAGTTALPTYGIRYVHGYAHAPASSITGNFIEGLNYGIYLPTDLANVGEIHINNNSITDSIEYGVYNGTTTALDAAYNWWGDDDPSDNASANVDYDPWYLDADMTWLSNQKVHNVTQDTWYETIQDAIDAASMAGGDTIAVAAGTFTENLTVYKSLTLQGAGSAQSVISVSNGIAVEVTADDVTIDGFEIKHSVVDDLADMGIRLNQSNGCIIQNNKINYNSLGLQLLDAGSNQILDNEFLYNAVGIYLEGTTDGEGHFDGGSNGPFYSLSLNNEIDGNIITYSIIMGEQGGDGIYLDAACESNVINNNTITDNAANGYYAWKASNNEITDNTISNNGDNGIHLFGSSGNTVTGNTLEENVNYGFWLRSGALSTTSNEITGNTVTGSGTGICLEDDFSTNNYLGVVTGNTISNNGIYENTDYGMRVIDVNPDDVNLPVDAADNWWGDATGPYHATTNPDGLGNAVSDNVLYEPWTGIIDDSDSVLWIRSDDVDDGVNSFFDVSATGHAVTPYGNAQHRNPVGKDSAIHFDGTGDYLSLAHSADWDFGTDDFTIDLWVNFTAAPSQNDGIFGSNRVVNWQLNGYVISYLDGAIQWQHSGTGTINTGITPVVGEWYHLAVVRSGGDLTFYVNGGDAATGAKVSKTIGSAAINSAGDGLLISRLRRQITGFEPACYMDEIRVTRSALWEDNFTPPNAPATSCLYNIDPTMEDIAAEGAIGNTVDVDASDENCEWTAASNAAWITITGGTSGTGDGTVTYDVAANNDASPRSGAMTIAGETFTVNQAGLDVSGVGAFIDVDGSGSYTVGDAEYTTIQAAINETDPALTGHAIGLLNGDYILTSTLNVNRPVTIFGQSESGVTIDTSDAGITAYGIDISASDVTLENFTLIPPANGTFAIHSGPDGLNQRNDLTLRNITIIGSQRTAFDINGYNGVTLQNLTARDTVYGSGIALSGCTNFDITGCVTEDNAWAGLMFQISNTTGGNCAGSFNMAANTLADGAQVQFPNGFGYTNDVTVSGSTYIIHNPDAPLGVSHSVWGYTDSTDEAMVVAAAVAGNVVNGLNTVWDVADSRYVIAPGLGIQTAIDAAIAGDTIDVGAGIYNEALNISKGITLQGAGYAGTIIDGTGLDAKPLVKITNSSGDVVFDGFTVQNGASSDGTHFQMTVSNGNPGNTVTISNNHIIGSGDDTNDDYGLYSSSGLSDLVFTANTVENCAYHGLFLERYKGATDISANHFTGMAGSVPVGFMTYENPGDADGSQDITEKQWVHDNIIDANGGHGIIVLAPYGMYYNHYKGGSFTNIEISNNIIYNVGDSYGKAIQFEIDSDGGGIYDAVISGNTLSSQTPGTGTSRGIRILAGAVNTQIIGNTITGFNQGVYQSYSWGQPGAVGPTGTVLRNNDISGNLSYGVENQYSDPANTIDATQNWWGDDTGPYHATTNPAGLGSAVSDNVLYDPWTGTLDESVLWIRSNDVDDGVNSFFDVSESGHAVTAYGNAQHRNPVGKDSAIHFDGNGDYLSLAHDEDWDFGTDDFTIDLWVNFTAVPAQYDGIFGSNRIVNWQFNGYMIFYDGSIQWQHSGTGVINSGITPVVGDWYHLAVVRNGSDLTFYVNGGDAATGAKISKTIGTAAINSAGDGLLISRLRRQISGYEPACYMDEIRVTRSALWEDNFTPPNPPFNP
jgi:parallel beta-helix repeat protein